MGAQELIDNGLIILNKPPGHTSHEISAFIKKITGSKKTGHAGTLDPNVSGVLPVALGRATKLLRYIASETKTYVGIIKFRNIQSREQILELFKKFSGEIVQTPPKISAVRKVPRKRTIYHLKLLEISKENPRLALFVAKVGAGTYIRTLCEDIGKKCGGARMEELRRIAVGEIHESQSVKMEDVVDAMWLLKNKNIESEINQTIHLPEKFIFLPRAIIRDSAIESIKSGAKIAIPAVSEFPKDIPIGQTLKLFSEGGIFIGIGIAALSSDDLLKKNKGIAIKLERMHL